MKLEKNAKMYGTLFSSVFMLSACTFGGGYVIVPLMRKKFVEDLHWIEEGEMMDLVAIAQSSPGAIAVNASISIGYRCAGIPGAIVAVIGTVLPPLVILTVISYCYEAFIQIRWIQVMLFGRWAGRSGASRRRCMCSSCWQPLYAMFCLMSICLSS